MKIDFAQTKHIVEKCWEIAVKADLPGAGEMMQGSGFGHVRLALFQQLVSQLVPNHQMFEGNTKGAIEVTEQREEWQG